LATGLVDLLSRFAGFARRAVLVFAAVLSLGAALAAAEITRVTPLAREGRILVSFEMRDAFTDDILAAISSGMTTTFTYEVELRRATALWIDRTIAIATVSASVRLDNLTGIYQVTRMQDGRAEPTLMLENLDEVRRWMTDFQRLALFNAALLEPNTEYYVRVRAHARPRGGSVWPFDKVAASAVAKFTFLP
jgi:hypothetical protein